VATPDQIRRRGRWSLVLGAMFAATALIAVAYADNVVNTLDTTVDVTKETMNLTVGGGNGSTFVWVQNVNTGGGDTNNPCNLAGAASLTVNVQSTDPSVATVSPSTVTIADCSNGNTADPAELAKMPQVTVTPVAAGSADITFSQNAFNGSGIFNYAPAAFTVVVTGASNVEPSADAGGPYSGAEGASISLDGTGSSDTDGSIASYSWTVTPHSGDVNDPDAGASCSFVDGTSASSAQPKVVCTDDGVYDLELSVTDGDGASDGDSTTLTLANANPSATPSLPGGDVDEGDAFSLGLTGPNDPGSNDAFQYQFDCGDGGGYSAASTTASRTCPTGDNGSRSVKLKVLDDDGGAAEYAGTVTIVNVAPTVAASFTAASVDCRTTATLTIDPDDAGVNDSPWKVNVDWGDGTSEPEITRTNLDSFTVTHVYALANAYSATVSVIDKDGDTGSDLTNGLTINQTYTVDFLPPFDDSTASGLIANKMKNGRVVPVKATLYDDCVGAFVTDPATGVTIKVSKTVGGGTGDPVEEYADAGQSSAGTNAFRWSSDGFWIYNLDSKALGLSVGTNYRVDMLVDGVKATVDTWAVLQPVK
jgi:hypothetical protein